MDVHRENTDVRWVDLHLLVPSSFQGLRGGCTVIEHLSHYPMVKGLNLTAADGTRRDKLMKKVFYKVGFKAK
jgi:hypothetical protein